VTHHLEDTQQHDMDPYPWASKRHKAERHEVFADWLVAKVPSDVLDRGVLDVAGGQGALSYYLTKKHNVRCAIVETKFRRGGKSTKFLTNVKRYSNLTDEALDQCGIVVAMHPDEATEMSIDAANAKFFAVVPCCVFHCLFPDRRMPAGSEKVGQEVVSYNDFMEYLMLSKGDSSGRPVSLSYLNVQGRNRVLHNF